MASLETAPTSRTVIGPAAWITSVPRAAILLARRAVRCVPDRVGQPLTLPSDGSCFVPFRHTRRVDCEQRATSVVLEARFHLTVLKPERRRLHGLFRAFCISTTPFFVGLPGSGRSCGWSITPRVTSPASTSGRTVLVRRGTPVAWRGSSEPSRPRGRSRRSSRPPRRLMLTLRHEAVTTPPVPAWQRSGRPRSRPGARGDRRRSTTRRLRRRCSSVRTAARAPRRWGEESAPPS
jgi:hypothetical protein